MSYKAGLADLHIHLSASASTHTMWEIAHQQGIRIGEKDYWKFLESFKVSGETSWETYHHHYDTAQRIQSSPQAIERTVHESISLSYRKSGVRLLELRFNPMRRNQEGLYDLDRLIFSAIVGMKRAMMEYPIQCGLIIEADRRFPIQENIILLQKAAKFSGEGVVGVDVSGPENDEFSMEELAPYFVRAKEDGLGVTVHTGEYIQPSNPEEIYQVVDLIKPDRIGHGIQAARDVELMKKISDLGIVLEICPTSNVKLNNVSGWDELGEIIQKFDQNGVKYTINSDGPVFLETNVEQEFEMLKKHGILDDEGVQRCIDNAHQATFIKNI